MTPIFLSLPVTMYCRLVLITTHHLAALSPVRISWKSGAIKLLRYSGTLPYLHDWSRRWLSVRAPNSQPKTPLLPLHGVHQVDCALLHRYGFPQFQRHPSPYPIEQPLFPVSGDDRVNDQADRVRDPLPDQDAV